MSLNEDEHLGVAIKALEDIQMAGSRPSGDHASEMNSIAREALEKIERGRLNIERHRAARANFLKGYPEHAKLEGRREERDTVVRFLEWLGTTHHRVINQVGMAPANADLVAKFLGIDARAFSVEKDRMLEELRGG